MITDAFEVTFVCTGNYYRSRFAEIYFNYMAPENGADRKSRSRGFRLSPFNIGPISPFALERLEVLGIPPSDPPGEPVALTAEDLKTSPRLIALDRREHLPYVRALFPDHEHLFEFWEIGDIDVTSPRIALPKLEASIDELIAEFRQYDSDGD